MLTIFLPLLIVLIIVALRLLYAKRMPWLLGSYLIILLIATGVYLILPKQDYVYSEQINQDEIPNLADLVYEGKSLDDVQLYIKNQWELPYDQNELRIVGQHNGYDDFNALIRVERKVEDDGIIEITHYKTPIIVAGLDVAEYMDPIDVELSLSTLKLIGLERIDIKLSTYRNDFPVRQFSEENWWLDWEYAFGRQVLALRIPSSLKITDVDEGFDIHYVQE